MSTIIAELSDDLQRCRRERVNAQKVTQIENERLQEILMFCQIYNESNGNQMSKRFNQQNEDNNNNDNNSHFKTNSSQSFHQSLSEDIFTKKSESRDSPLEVSTTQMRSEFSSSTLNSRDSGSSDSGSADTGNADAINSKSSESLNALIMEEALVSAELNDIQHQQFSDCDDGDDDQDLREFQKIEREIKVSELTKCLQMVQKQIDSYTKKRDSFKSDKSNKSDAVEAPLADSESYADGQSTETEKDDSPEPKIGEEDDNLSIESKELPIVAQKPLVQMNKKSQLRPLTLYLPSPDEELNLVNHIQTLGHDLTNQPSLIISPFTCSGYLYKLCTNSESKWRKRFFHFDRQHKIFVYYRNERNFKKMRKPSGGVYFDEIHDVYVDWTKMKPKSNDNQSARCVFIVGAARRRFILSTFKPELMRIWIDVIFTGAGADITDFDTH